MTITADLDQLAHLCRLAAADVAAWEDQQEALRPDGHRANMRASGMPTGKGGISDPTGAAAAALVAMDETGTEVRATCGRITSLAIAIHVATLGGHDPSMGSMEVTASLRLHVAARALDDVGRTTSVPAVVPWHGVQVAIADARDSMRAELVGLRTIVAATKTDKVWQREEYCPGHVRSGERPHTRDDGVPAIKDGLCQRCYDARRYDERRKDEAA